MNSRDCTIPGLPAPIVRPATLAGAGWLTCPAPDRWQLLERSAEPDGCVEVIESNLLKGRTARPVILG